jgi:CBS domain-containing protein
MAAHRIHSVVVEGVPFTVITDSELAAALCEGGMATTTAGEIARPALIVAPDEPVVRAAELMVEHGTTHAIVVDELAQRAVGVISVLDVAETVVQPTPRP